MVRGWQVYGKRLRALSLAASLSASTLVFASPYFVYGFATQDTPVDPRVDIWADVDRSQGKHGRDWGAYLDADLGSVRVPGTMDTRAQAAVCLLYTSPSPRDRG